MKSANELALSKQLRILLLVTAGVGLVSVFLFQRTNFFYGMVDSQDRPNLVFILNRASRLLLNDLFMLLLLAGWFKDRGVLKLAFVIQLVDFFILLPLYLIAKLIVEGDSEISTPLLSQFHRLIVNPTLMILLIPAVYFQRQLNTHAK